MIQKRSSPQLIDYLTLVALSLIWGTSYILIKRGLEVFTPAQVATLRLGISALALLPFAVVHLRKISWSQVPLLIVIGITGTGLPSFLFPFAQTELSSSLTGMLSSLTPLCTFIVAYFIFGSREGSNRQLAGVLVGLCGAILLAWAAPGVTGQTTRFLYTGFILMACFCYAISSNLVGAYFKETSALTITVTSFVLVGTPALIWALSAGAVLDVVLSTADGAGWWALGYVAFLAVFSTVLSSVVFFRMVQRTGAVFASTVSYIIPLVALSWGLLDGEALSYWQLPAVALVLVGVWLSKR
ncbi:DMT family transporter [Neolewinella antarctica]|uniref:Drug/metabolite transporter (DMT)-like permease n=1 Tax=Neolewinella antarctica TaxID=442734 RepID=A0ABX0XA06_9BACT|nr:DMT family transporter [Neolewinella antarctica]NJC26085.1 drug/metabolite transporter (DMT)-like permease [Neolewinella antarctica]